MNKKSILYILIIGVVVIVGLSVYEAQSMEKSQKLLEDCIKENVSGKCGADSECIGMAETYCGHLLRSGCKFGPFGEECP